MLGYQRQDSPLTLAEGLEEYYRAHPGLKRGDTLSAEARAFFERHDAVHVVYGCDTTLPHEAVVKLASFFGTTEGLKVMEGYRLYDSLDIYRQLRLADILATLTRSPVLVPRTIWRCRRQSRPWPWDAFEDYMGSPLAALRADYGIRVAA